MHNGDNRANIGGFLVGNPEVTASPYEQILAGVLPGDTPAIANQKIQAWRLKVPETASAPVPPFGPAIDVTDGMDTLLDHAAAAIRLAFRFFPFVVPLLILSRYGDRYVPFGLNFPVMNLLRWASVPWFIYQAVRGIAQWSRRSDKADGARAKLGTASRPIYERKPLPDGKIAITFRQRRLNFVATDIVLVLPVVVLALVGVFVSLYVAVTYNFFLGPLCLLAILFGPVLIFHRLNWRKQAMVIEPGISIRCDRQSLRYQDIHDFGWESSQRKGKGGFLSTTDSFAYVMTKDGKKVRLTKEMRGNSAASICGLVRDLAYPVTAN